MEYGREHYPFFNFEGRAVRGKNEKTLKKSWTFTRNPFLKYDENHDARKGSYGNTGPERFCGREVNEETLKEIKKLYESCSGLSRTELANTVCELWDWKRPVDGLRR